MTTSNHRCCHRRTTSDKRFTWDFLQFSTIRHALERTRIRWKNYRQPSANKISLWWFLTVQVFHFLFLFLFIFVFFLSSDKCYCDYWSLIYSYITTMESSFDWTIFIDSILLKTLANIDCRTATLSCHTNEFKMIDCPTTNKKKSNLVHF
jgi:hypothetical protein